MLAVILAATGTIGSVLALFSAIYAAGRHAGAERALRKEMLRHREQSLQLELIKARLLELETPDPKQLTSARNIIVDLTQELNESKRSNILNTLDRGSDKNKANYIVKLVQNYQGGTAQAD